MFERSGTVVTKRRMPPLPVVKELDVLDELRARRRPRVPHGVENKLDLQCGEEALGDRVVPAIAAAAHTADDAVLGENALVGAASVLTAAIRMMQQALGWAPPGQRHAERLEGQ